MVSKIYVQGAMLFGLLAVWAAWRQLGPSLPPQITPLKAPLMKQLPEFDAEYKDSMLWGSYRAGHYFGMRTRWVNQWAGKNHHTIGCTTEHLYDSRASVLPTCPYVSLFR
jgi:hypothetical protein